MNSLLIISAIKQELVNLQELHNQKIGDKIVFILNVGIGKINSILSLGEWYYNFFKKKYYKSNLEIIFTGSCGSYHKIYPEFIYSNNFINYDINSLYKKSKSIEEVSGIIQTQRGDLAGLILKSNPMEEGIINTTDSITLKEIDSQLFFHLQQELHSIKIYENLECYGIAKFCDFYKISFTAFLSVTNYVSENGSKEWKNNYKKLAKKLNSFLKNSLYSL